MGLSNPIRLRTLAYFSQRVSAFAGPMFLMLLGAWTFANCFQGQFVFDDRIWLDQLATMPSIWSESFWLQGQEGPHHGRPFVAASFALNYWLAGEQPAGYHAVNLTLHILAGLAMFGILRRSFAHPDLPASLQSAAQPLALATTAIWLVHPLQNECVNYVSQRTECSVGLSILLSLYCVIRSSEQSPAKLGWMILAVAAAWFGAGCKELAALIPILAVLYEQAFRTTALRRLWRDRWKFYAALCSCWIPVATMIALAPRTNTVGSNDKAGVIKYLLNQCMIIPEYVSLAFWPDNLALDYGEPIDVSFAEAAPYGLMILATFAAGVLWIHRRPQLAFAIWWFFVLLAPTSSIIPIQTEVGAERRMYLPLAALAAVVVAAAYWSIHRIFAKVGRERQSGVLVGLTSLAVLGLALAPLSARTRDRNLQYRDIVDLWMSSSEARPNNPRAIYNLGVRFARMGKREIATAAFAATLKIDPTYAVAHNNLGIMLRDGGNYAAAKHHFMKAAEHQKNWTLALHNLARLYATCPDETIRDGKEAVHIAEAIHRTHPMKIEYIETLAAAYAEAGEFEKSVATLMSAKAIVAEQHPSLLSRLEQQLERYRWELPLRLEHSQAAVDPIQSKTALRTR